MANSWAHRSGEIWSNLGQFPAQPRKLKKKKKVYILSKKVEH